MTPNQADQQIVQWQDKQALIEENLRSFVQLPVFQRLSIQGPQQFRGQTQQHIAAAVDVFQSLQQQQAILSQTLNQAKSKREALRGILPSKQTLAEIDHLLNGKSIQLAATPTPPERRELLRDVEQAQWITPARLLEIMLDSFRHVRDTVLAISEAEDQARQSVQNGEAAIARLQTVSDSLGGLGAQPLANARQSLADLTIISAQDPLAAQAKAEAFLRSLRAASAQVEGAGRRRDAALGQLANGQFLLAQVRETIDRGKPLRIERELKVLAPPNGLPQPPSDQELEALTAWLAKLQSTVENADHGPAVVGLEKWTLAANELFDRARQCADADAAALSDRRELRGLFESLQAKAINMCKANDPALENLQHEIHRLLAHRPSPLPQVRELVAQYQRRLA